MDVDGMLERLPAGTVDRWFEYYKLEPWGDDWERADMIVTNLMNLVIGMAPRQEGDEPVWVKQGSLMPFAKLPKGEDPVQAAYEGLSALRGLNGGRL